VLVHERGLAASREQARRLILGGQVTVDGAPAAKPGAFVRTEAALAVAAPPRFVSRGGDKLEAALARFGLEVAGLVCADVGASTGGFTDCLLQRGAARVYAIDVGHDVLAEALRADSRVISLENTNARYLERLPERVDFSTIDAAFISLKLLFPAVAGWGARDLVALVKPQFEAGRADIGKQGVVRDPAAHGRVLREVIEAARAHGLGLAGLMASPVVGPKGNVEFLLWLARGAARLEAEGAIAEALAASQTA
jgi:23S rRNA (cytidine1920-2'-O)/16S rRNA (cytidine1409-2'-O)-methyltransferase